MRKRIQQIEYDASIDLLRESEYGMSLCDCTFSMPCSSILVGFRYFVNLANTCVQMGMFFITYCCLQNCLGRKGR